MNLESEVVARYRNHGLTFATAESCTGGWVAVRVTSVPGASEVFFGGIVGYDNSVKQRLLEVPKTLLDADGAVSEACAEAMAKGACRALHVDVAVSVTGIAGPGGGTPQKPVGLVFIGVATARGTQAQVRRHLFSGDRASIRNQATDAALQMLLDALSAVP